MLTHRYTAVVAIHVHIIVTHHGQSFKAPLAYQTCTRGSVRRASGFVLTGDSDLIVAARL